MSLLVCVPLITTICGLPGRSRIPFLGAASLIISRLDALGFKMIRTTSRLQQTQIGSVHVYAEPLRPWDFQGRSNGALLVGVECVTVVCTSTLYWLRIRQQLARAVIAFVALLACLYARFRASCRISSVQLFRSCEQRPPNIISKSIQLVGTTRGRGLRFQKLRDTSTKAQK